MLDFMSDLINTLADLLGKAKAKMIIDDWLIDGIQVLREEHSNLYNVTIRMKVLVKKEVDSIARTQV